MKKLRKYQKKIVDFILPKEYVYLNASMRSGKTLISAEVIKQTKLKTLVVAPPKTLPHWEKELEEHGAVADVVSINKLKTLLGNRKIDLDYEFIVLDEIHKIRNYSNFFLAVRTVSKNSKKRLGPPEPNTPVSYTHLTLPTTPYV